MRLQRQSKSKMRSQGILNIAWELNRQNKVAIYSIITGTLRKITKNIA